MTERHLRIWKEWIKGVDNIALILIKNKKLYTKFGII